MSEETKNAPDALFKDGVPQAGGNEKLTIARTHQQAFEMLNLVPLRHCLARHAAIPARRDPLSTRASSF